MPTAGDLEVGKQKFNLYLHSFFARTTRVAQSRYRYSSVLRISKYNVPKQKHCTTKSILDDTSFQTRPPPPSTVFAPARTWLMNIAVGGCGVVCVCLFCTVTQLHLIAKSISLKSIFASPENKNNLINKDAIYKSSQTHSCTYRVGF